MSMGVNDFWSEVRRQFPLLPKAPPPAWSFGVNEEQADELLYLVLGGTKTATASALLDYESDNSPVPVVGELSIVLDGKNNPRAVVETTDVTVVPFVEVTAEHAFAEGEGDRRLDSWRTGHQEFWQKHMINPQDFSPTMLVVCERFRLVYPLPDAQMSQA